MSRKLWPLAPIALAALISACGSARLPTSAPAADGRQRQQRRRQQHRRS